MSASKTQRPNPSAAERRGGAVLHLHGGEYVCSFAELEPRSGIVTFEGALRVRDLTGERRYEGTTRSRKLRAGEWIEWLAASEVAA